MFTQIPEWLESFAPRTRPNYRKSAMILLDYLNSQNVNDVTLSTLQNWRRSIEDTLPGLRGHIVAIKSFFKFLYNQGHTTSNLGRCLKVPKQLQIRVERNMSKQQVLDSIAFAPNNRLLLTLLFYLGARVSEVIRIERDDITATANGLQFKLTGKGDKIRHVKITTEISDYVKSQLRHYPRYLFPGRNGHITRKCAWQRVKRAVKKVLPRALGLHYDRST